jgi:hypothetical protein
MGESVTYTTKAGVASTISGIPGVDPSDDIYEEDQYTDGTGLKAQMDWEFLESDVPSPGIGDTVTWNGVVWTVSAYSPPLYGNVVVSVERYTQVNKVPTESNVDRK